MYIDHVFIDRLKSLCKENSIKMKDLLDKCNLSKNLVYEIEKRGSKPSIESVCKLADFFNVSVDFLVTGKESDFDSSNYIALNDDEFSLIEVYRELTESQKDELNGRAVRLLKESNNKKSYIYQTTGSNAEEDVEFAKIG